MGTYDELAGWERMTWLKNCNTRERAFLGPYLPSLWEQGAISCFGRQRDAIRRERVAADTKGEKR